MAEVLESVWGRLFRGWESTEADENGYPVVGEHPAEIKRTGFAAFVTSLKILWTCIREAPELAQRRKMSASAKK